MSSDRQFAQQLSVTRLFYMPLPSSEIMFPFKLANLLPAWTKWCLGILPVEVLKAVLSHRGWKKQHAQTSDQGLDP